MCRTLSLPVGMLARYGNLDALPPPETLKCVDGWVAALGDSDLRLREQALESLTREGPDLAGALRRHAEHRGRR